MTRGAGLFREKARRQKGAIAAILAGYFPALGGFTVWIINCQEEDSLLMTLGVLLLVYSSFAYAYFHLFNMSETARRIHILSQGGENGFLGKEGVEKNYTGEQMVQIRLERLVALRELTLQQNLYYPGRMLLLLPARIVFGCRSVIFPSRLPYPDQE